MREAFRGRIPKALLYHPEHNVWLRREGDELVIGATSYGAYFAGEGTRDISEFFVLRRHRRRGVGTEVARRVFDRYPGKWEVTQLTRNVDAQAFWRRVIGDYTGGRYDELPRPDGRGVMQRFDNGRR